MTDRAVFGDFAQVARQHLTALAPRPGDSTQLNPASVASQIREYSPDLSRILSVMSRCISDIAAPAHLGQNPVRKTSSATRHLAAAADAMIIGRDLLQTHFTSEPGCAPRPCSEWSAMVRSAPGHRALLTEMATWARKIAAHTEHLTTAPTLPGQTAAADQKRLAGIRRDLLTVAETAATASAAEPVSEADVRQLYSIPLNIQPRRQLSPAGDVPSLCQASSVTAERVRRAFAATVPDAAWSPDLTGESFRQAASLAAVVSQHSELVQQSLAGTLHPPFLSGQMRQSASVTANATRLWLAASSAWRTIETDTASTRTPPAITELADLMLWTGRLAHANPAWAPGLATDTAAPSPTKTGHPRPGLTMADLPEVKGALRQVTTALVAVAAADYDRTRTAARNGRLLTPTEPAKPDRRYQSFTRISGDQATALLNAYRDAGAATAQASNAFVLVVSKLHHYQTHHENSQPRQPRPPFIPPDRRMDPALPAAIALDRDGGKMPGPVERILVQLGVTDADYLSQGAALDQAASELIDQAAQHTAAQRWNTAVAGRDSAVDTREIIDHLLARDQRRPAPPTVPKVSQRVAEMQAER